MESKGFFFVKKEMEIKQWKEIARTDWKGEDAWAQSLNAKITWIKWNQTQKA